MACILGFRVRLRAAGRRLAVLFAAALVAGAAGAQINLPDFGDSASAVISPVDEKRLGEAFMREIRATLTLVDDPEIATYIQSLGYKLVSSSSEQDLGFTFFVVADPAINAFAAPGGYIGVHSGLVLAAESESELAAVLAHEVAHVTQRHIARAIEMADASSLPAMAGIIAAIILGTQNPAAGQAAVAAVTAGNVQRQIDFTRSNEQEADRVGIQTLASAGYDPHAMPSFFERLQQSLRYYTEPPEFLSTHPVTGSRIADSRGRAEQYPFRHYTDSLAFKFVRAKLRVITEPDHRKALEYFTGTLKTAPEGEHPGLRYGQALAWMALGENAKAREQLQALIAEHPQSIPLRDSLARVELAAGRSREALGIYTEALRLYPDDKVLIRGYAEALLAVGEHAKTLALIEGFARYNALDAPLLRLKAQALQMAGETAASRLTLAEAYYQDGKLDAAIQQLRLARQSPERDFYMSSRIEARLAQLEEEHAQRSARR